MTKKIFISGLPYELADQDLNKIFAEYGTVRSAKVITDRDTGKSRGFGFVEIEEDDKADAAIAELNGAMIENKTIAVSIARPPENKGNGARPARGGFGNAPSRGGYGSDRPRSGGFGGGGRGGNRGSSRGS